MGGHFAQRQALNIRDCIIRFGAAPYLAGLRKRYMRGHYNFEHFAYLAARTYLNCDLPRRAIALLKGIPPEYRPSSKQPTVAEILSKSIVDRKRYHQTCSLNMIVKNECHNIEQALDSVDSYMDEIVICDTGSLDDTVERARMYGAKVVHQNWEDDFSKARNAAIRESTCSWIFWLDADDRLDKESGTALSMIFESMEKHCIYTRILNIREKTVHNEFMQPRIFPRISGLEFSRKVHEQIAPNAKKLGVPFTLCKEIVIHHLGYKNEQINISKAERNRKLILAQLEETPGDPSLLLSLGDSWFISGFYGEARKVYLTLIALASRKSIAPHMHAQALFYLALTCKKLFKIRDAEFYLSKCIEIEPNRIEAWFEKGVLLKDELKNSEACECFEQAVSLTPPIRTTSSNDHEIKIQALYAHADILLKQFRFTETEQLLKTADTEYTHTPILETQLGHAYYHLNNFVEAARHYMASISLLPENNPEPFKGMAEIYSQMGDQKKANDFMEKARKLTAVKH